MVQQPQMWCLLLLEMKYFPRKSEFDYLVEAYTLIFSCCFLETIISCEQLNVAQCSQI